MIRGLEKAARIATTLEPHQTDLIDQVEDEDGTLMAWGMGSGKTLGALAAADSIGAPTEIFTPASLVNNFNKEIQKHIKGRAVPMNVRSVSTAAQQNYQIPRGSTFVVDEAHMARNPEAMRSKYLKEQARRAGKVMLLTGTPSYNQPENVAPLINMVSREDVLPESPTAFRREFIEDVVENPGLLGWLLGVKPGSVGHLKNRERLLRAIQGKVSVYDSKSNMPKRVDKDIDVEMSPQQEEVYDYLEDELPWSTKFKIRWNLPPNKTEAKDMNAFSTGLRQASNAPGSYISGMTPLQSGQASPKLLAALKSIQAGIAKDPNFRGFTYSNFMGSGVTPMSALLDEAKIPNAVYSGEMPMMARKKLIDQYNLGKLKVLLGTSAAGEGLDLKGTKLIQILEPHFNDSKIEQAIARGIRFGSHDQLPENEREVQVERYHSNPRQGWLSRLFTGKNTGIDRYLRERAADKDRLAGEFKQLFEEAQQEDRDKRNSWW